MRFFFTFYTFLFFRTVLVFAQPNVFERITIENGLSQGMIFDVLQTRDGFLWVATKDGLNRYDGYNFKVFSNDPFDPLSLAENTVTNLFEDSRGWLWVGTESKGVDVYDRQTGQFHHFALNFNHTGNSGYFEVTAMTEAADGSMYMLQASSGLVHIVLPKAWQGKLPAEPELSQLATVTLFPADRFHAIDNLQASELRAIARQPDEAIWVYSSERIYLVEAEKNIITPVPAQTAGGDSGNAQNFWVSSDLRFTLFHQGKATVFNFPDRAKNIWIRSVAGPDGTFWLGFNHQLWLLSPGEIPDFSKPDWVLDENITTVKTDRNGNVWIGTQGYGLRKFNPRKQSFHAGAAGTSIWGVWCDNQGKYYCKVVNEVFPYDPVSGQIGTTRAFAEKSKRVLDMCIDPQGLIWLLGRGNEDNGKASLWRENPQTGESQAYPFDYDSYIYARLLRSPNGHFWITGLNCQLIRFNPETGNFDYYNYAALFGEKVNTVRAFALAEDGNGILWIGTQQGLVKCIPNGTSFSFELLKADPKNPNGLNNNVIACLLPDPAHPGDVLWIGTKGGGINRLDLRSGQCQHITTADGLSDKVIYGILPGNEPPATAAVSLWCSTNRGLAKIIPRATTPPSYEITTFTATKGLQDNEFNTQAFFKAASGELMFGGVNGLNHFFPGALRRDTIPPPVFMVGIEINHQPIEAVLKGDSLPTPVEYLEELHLTYAQNNLSFEFAALDFTDPAQNRYRYRLVGLDADWVETENIRFAHFTHLAPGRYEFRVQGSNGEGVWKDADHAIVVIVHPPWYRSNLAYLSYILLFAWAVWWAYQFQISRLKEREQLVYEQRETERVKTMEQTKTNFFSNITHEFRTPLSLIVEPARRILAKTKDPEIIENARYIETSSHRLLSLVNQLMDMAKLESGSMGLDLRRGDFAAYLRSVFQSFKPLAARRDIQFSLKMPTFPEPLLFDPVKVELVLNNLISNALKFTPAAGEVTVACLPASPDTLVITVSDTGIGIPADALDKVFDRFYQVDSSHTRAGEGTGIGLALSKELAELMGGSITVQSVAGQGATFTFLLPMVTSIGEGRVSADPIITQPDERIVAAIQLQHTAELPSVLLIEDNAELRSFVKACIAHAWQVVEASNGEEGVEKAVELLPDLVISDVMMPNKDGYAVCDALKTNELTSHIPIILLTAKSTTDAKLKGLRIGADDYLTKPFNSEELLARMQNLVDIRRCLRRRYGQISPVVRTPDETAILSLRDREFLHRFTLIVEQYLSDETIGVEDLAQKMFVSRVQLHRKLKAITDHNVTDFVRDYRLERAMSMLKNREGLVYEIASRVGFGSEKYFSRAFKEKFGVPPSQIA